MKKKVLSILLTAAMVMSMAVGCGSNKSASTDAKDDTKTEHLLMGKATRFCSMVLLHWHRLLLLSQRISSIHMEHGKLMIPLFQMKILQFMFPQVVPDKEQKLLSMVHLLSVW